MVHISGSVRSPRRSRLAIAAFAGVLVAATVTVGVAGSGAVAAAPTPLAPVIGTAANGGAVIVWLTDQHSNLNLRTQSTQRTADARADQAPLVADITANGGTDVVQLVSVNAVAAHVSAAEVQRLRAQPGVKEIIPDSTVTVGDPETTGPHTHATTTPDRDALRIARRAGSQAANAGDNAFPTADCGTQDDPLIEPEALDTIHAPAMTNAGLDTEPGHGVIVANDGISSPPSFSLVGNPNFVRPAADGGGSVVVDAQPGDTTDATDGEYYGDASSIDAQGTVVYDYSQELPFSGLPATTCYFKLVGDAPGASLVDTENITTPESAAGDPATTSDSAMIAGIDAAVIQEHADVINESYGYGLAPGSYAIHYAANDAAIAAGVTVVASSGDSGSSGTVSSPASDPLVIAVGATNTLRLNAMAYGFADWVNNDITPLSSGGTTPNNRVVDLVAPGYGGEAACNPNGSDCPTNTQTEAFGGTSESSPLVAGAAADVIQAFRDSHNGDSPSPALVKQLLTGTATDVHAPADQQGAGLLNINAAVAAAQQTPNSTVQNSTSNLTPTPTQLDVSGAGGSSSSQSVSLYNAGATPATVTGTYRSLGSETQIGSTVTENVSAPDPALPVPSDGAQAAPDVTFTVPAGLDRLDADMIWPDATNGAILNFVLIDPEGRLRQLSYDYGSTGTGGRLGSVPDIQHVEVADPEAGTWTAEIKWGNGRSHLQEAPNLPGSYTGTMSFNASGQNWVTSPASAPVTIAAHRSATIPLSVNLPGQPGDHPASVQFTGTNAAGSLISSTSLPIARRTTIPTAGGPFNVPISSTVGRGVGGISSYAVEVTPGQADLGVQVQTPDASANNGMTLFLVNPSGTSVATHTVTTGNPPRSRVVNGVPLVPTTVGGQQVAAASYNVANPMAGMWEIDVELNLTTSGQEFTQTVSGDVLPQAPVISTPTDGSTASTPTPTLSGSGTPGDTVTVVDGAGDVLCTAVADQSGAWSCTSSSLDSGTVTFTATQADSTANASPASNAVTVTVPAATSVALAIAPAAPARGKPFSLTATTTGVADGAIVTFHDGSATLGTAPVTAGTATLTDAAGLSVGQHSLTASVDATDSAFGSVSPAVVVTVAKDASTIAVTLSAASVAYGTPVTGSVAVTGATAGTATVGFGATPLSVPIDANGAGSFSLPPTLRAGTHAIAVSYGGTDTVGPSGPVDATLTVTKAPTTTTIFLEKKRITSGKADHLRISVGGHLHGAYPNGSVTITATVGSKKTTRTVALHQARHGHRLISFTLPDKVGTARVVATFTGNRNFGNSTSKVKLVTVLERHRHR